MIAAVVAFITTRIVAVFTTTVVIVAAVPSLIVITHGGGSDVTIVVNAGSGARVHGDDERDRMIVEVNSAGDDLVARLNAAEATCDSQIAQLAAQSKLSAVATQAALDKGKADLHTAVAPFVREVGDDQDEFDHLTTVSVETEQVFLTRISEVKTIALGEGSIQGVLVTVCQTILVEVRVTITTIVVQTGGGGEDD